MIYNSAIKNGTYTYDHIAPIEEFKYDGNIGFKNNIIVDGLPNIMYEAEVIYCEPPFPKGLEFFDKKANFNTETYSVFAISFAEAIEALLKAGKPIYVIMNKALSRWMPKPKYKAEVKLNQHQQELYIYNDEKPPKSIKTNLALCEYLGTQYSIIGDITCGYGIPCLVFRDTKADNKFIACDYDGSCIAVLKGLSTP